MKELLTELEKHCDCKFAEIHNGIAIILSTKEIIPEELMLFQKTPKDGFYEIGEHTCPSSPRAGCAIGKPAQRCIDKGIYTKRKCAVWGFTPARKTLLNVKIMNEVFKSIKQNG